MSELKAASCFEFEKVLRGKSNKLFYSKSDADKVISELKEIIAKNQSAYYVDLGIVANDCEKLKAENERLEEKNLEYKETNDVLVTDNRDLLDKVKKLEERLHENAEHFKRNEAQIIENADMVIAEKDKEIAELQKQVHDYAQGLYVIQARAEKEARHHKYKRCLAMAKWCRLHDEFTQLESERLGLPQRAIFMEYRRKAMWWNKWHKRWLELAEQFKEKK